MSASLSIERRELWQPSRDEQIAAATVLLRHDLHHDAREAIKRRLADWLEHANGCRRRAHEYKRWALEYETAGNLEKYRHYRKESDRQWRTALDAMVHARRDFDFIKGASQWH